MLRRTSRFVLVLVGAALLLVAGCGGDSGDSANSDRPSRDDDTVDDGKRDESRKRDIDREDPSPGECACDPGEICHPETGECIALAELPEGDLYGEVDLELYTWVMDDRTGGRAYARFFVYEQPPARSLQEYYTDDNELCLFFDDYTVPPKWPQGRTLDAGELTFTVEGGDEPIVLENNIDPNDGSVDYWLKKGSPPRDNMGLFDEDHLPLEATFSVEGAGGGDIGAFIFDAGTMPEAFEIDPEAERTSENEMIVRWDPPQPAATMEISGSWGMGILTCWVRDDGEAKIPWFPGVELKRITARLATVDADGEELRLLVKGEHGQSIELCTDDCNSGSRTP